MRSVFLSPVIFLITLVPNCSHDCGPRPDDDNPPVIVINSPDLSDSFCEGFSVEGTVTDNDAGIEEIILYVDGEEVELVELNNVLHYDFEFNVTLSDFPASCGDVDVDVVATDAEQNDSTEDVEVFLCDDSTAPVIIASTDEDTLTSEDHCTTVTVQITEDNLVEYEVAGFVSGSENDFVFEVCGSDLEIGENALSVTAWDFCGNEGSDSITITYNPNAP